MTKALFIIDPQNDFIDAPNNPGSLAVPGSFEDMQRLSTYIKKGNFDKIFVSLDTHAVLDIAHKSWWVNDQGVHPADFTNITVQDVVQGVWKSVQMPEHSLYYVQELAKQGKYNLTIWPDHCIKGTKGHAVQKDVATALMGRHVEYVVKGTNPQTEHYSALKAEVVLTPDTALNTTLIDALDSYDSIEIAGEALSHCVASTVRDLIANIADSGKVSLLTDTMSPVPGFEPQARKFLIDMARQGVSLKTTSAPKNYRGF